MRLAGTSAPSSTQARLAAAPSQPPRLAQPRHVCNATDSSGTPISLGIDLGTTNSVAAVVRGSKAKVRFIPVEEDGTWTLPSVVAYQNTAQPPLVGRQAAALMATQPETTFFSTKRLMGRRAEDVAEVLVAAFLRRASAHAVPADAVILQPC